MQQVFFNTRTSLHDVDVDTVEIVAICSAFCFPVLYAVQKGAPLVAQLIGVGALSLHLENYSIFWAIMFGTQILIFAVLCMYLPETLPNHKRTNMAPTLIVLLDLQSNYHCQVAHGQHWISSCECYND